MSLQVGNAYSSYDLDLAGLRKSIAEAKRLLDDLRKSASAPLPAPKVSGSAGDPAAAATKAALAQQKLQLAQQRTAQTANQAAVAAQRLATEENKTAREAANTAAAQDRAAKSALSLAAAQQKAAQQAQGGGLGPALPRTFAGFTPGGLNQAAGAFGLATIGPQVIGQTIQLGIESGKAALALRETKNSLRAVAGDLTTYNTTLAAAKDQQRLFGGTLQENIEGLSGLTITARSSGASLQALIGLSQRLAVLDPAQGAQGARIALNEALSGDPTSLAKRYEIPRAALAKLRDTALPVEERLAVIDSFLSKVGITAESVAGRVDQDALAFRKLNAELETTKLNAGDRLATAFTGAATGLTRVLGLINQNPQAIAELKALLGGRGEVTGADLTDVTRNLASARAKNQLGGDRGENVVSRRFANTEEYHNVREQLTEINIAGGVAADQADALSQAFIRGTVSAATYSNGIAALLSEQRAGGDVEDLRAQRLTSLSAKQDAFTNDLAQLTSEMNKSAHASIEDAAAKDAQQAKTTLLGLQTKNAVDAFFRLNPRIDESGIAALVAAGKLDVETGKLAALRLEASATTDEIVKLNNANAQANLDKLITLRASQGTGSGRDGGSDAQADAAAFVGVLKTQNQEAAALLDSEIALAAAKKQTAKQIELLRQKQAQFQKGSAEFNSIEAQIIGVQEAAGKTRVSAAQSTALQLQNVEETSQLQLLKAQREGLERLRDQQADFDLHRARSKEDEDEKIRGLLARGQKAEAARERADFEKQQRRDLEDFNIQRQRTTRNNGESSGDINNRTDLRQSQIGNRAALRGVRTGNTTPLDSSVPTIVGANNGTQAGASLLQVNIQAVVNLEAQKVGELIFETIKQKLDESFSLEIRSATAPGASQTQVAGARP
jgi:hypothetical protein